LGATDVAAAAGVQRLLYCISTSCSSELLVNLPSRMQQQWQQECQQQAHYAALQAMCMAFERKLRIVSSIGGN
jgi:hypothetical protein